MNTSHPEISMNELAFGRRGEGVMRETLAPFSSLTAGCSRVVLGSSCPPPKVLHSRLDWNLCQPSLQPVHPASPGPPSPPYSTRLAHLSSSILRTWPVPPEIPYGNSFSGPPLDSRSSQDLLVAHLKDSRSPHTAAPNVHLDYTNLVQGSFCEGPYLCSRTQDSLQHSLVY